jgi:transcriptional regulator with XRE-family HTH domain
MMQPYELVRALVHEQTRHGKSVTEIAREMQSRNFQGTLHKFLSGQVREPSRATAERIARYFKLPLEALYDVRVATAEAARRGLPALPERDTTIRLLREPQAAYGATPSTALSPALLARLAALPPTQVEAIERIIQAHLDAMDLKPAGAA